jgi:hypothetical protein
VNPLPPQFIANVPLVKAKKKLSSENLCPLLLLYPGALFMSAMLFALADGL